MPSPSSRSSAGIYSGWFVVLASGATTAIAAATVFYGMNTFLNDLISEFGWAAWVTFAGSSVRTEVGGISAPFVGWAIDKFGPRRVLIIGIGITSLGLLLMSNMTELWHFFLVMGLISVGSSTAGNLCGFAAIVTWFERKRARALTLSTLGGSLGGLLIPIVAIAVGEFGWRSTLQLLALLVATGGLTFGMFVRTRPDKHPQPIDGMAQPDTNVSAATSLRNWGVPVSVAIRTRSFALLMSAFVANGFAMMSLLTLAFSYFEHEYGLTKGAAGLTITVLTVSSIFGRIILGFQGDRYQPAKLLGLCAILLTLGLPLLSIGILFADGSGVWIAFAGLIISAIGFGGSVPLRSLVIVDFYGTASFGKLMGTERFISTIGGTIGPILIGVSLDITNHYTWGWFLTAAVGALAIPLYFSAKRPETLIDEYKAKALVGQG
ncbi:MAG TPA: MFS transporter [Gemmatimonadetes bacterium]|nr:MFS transporter [Gemmatimonadota bacterium]